MIDLIINLQLFSDDEEENNTVEEVVTEEAGTTESEYDIPYNEVFNVSDETINMLRQEYPDEFEEVENNNDDEATEEVNSTNQNPETTTNTNQAEDVDYKALYENQRAELERIKAQYGTNTNSQTAPQTQVNNLIQDPVVNNNTDMMNGIKLTPEANKIFEELVKEKTKAICNLSEEDLESLIYLDEDDDKKRLYRNAELLARQQVANQVEQQAAILRQQELAIQRMQEASRNDIASFVNEVRNTPNYDVIDKHIGSTFFNKLTPMEQMAVKEAYARANSGNSTIMDNVILRNFWKNGLSDYNSTFADNNNKGNIQNKMKQRNKMPRASALTGNNTVNANSWDLDKLEQALNTPGGWESIPDEIRKRVLAGEL